MTEEIINSIILKSCERLLISYLYYIIVEMAENFKDSLTQLNQIIEKLEVTTGSAHQPQPQVTATNTTVPK